MNNDTFFLSIISVVDYSILVGFDEDSHEIVVGIIDYMRQVRRRDLCTVQYSTVQYSTVQYSTVQCSAVQYSTVQYSAVQYSTV